MDKMIVVTFDSEEKAYAASKEFKELHYQGDIALYGLAVIAKDADGNVTTKEAADEGPLGTAVGMFSGTMVGLVAVAAGAAPVAAAVGLAGGGLIGATADLTEAGIDAEFLGEVDAALEPGKVAVVAEAAENWVTPVDSRMEALGGVVLRHGRADYVDDLIDQDIEQTKADFANLKEEYQQSTGEAKAKVKAKMDATQAKLDALAQRAKERGEASKAETKAKVETLEAQAKKANENTKKKFQDWAAKLKAKQEARNAKLKAAWEKTKAKVTA